MHIRLIAVSDRQPQWVEDAFEEYSKRFPSQWRFRLDTVSTSRRGGDDKALAVRDEGLKVLKQLQASETVVILDVQGTDFTSEGFAVKLNDWQTTGRDLAFVIGGPDGFSNECMARADFRWSLSRLTLPHGLARVVFAEQLYRAFSLLQGHPYHRA